MSHTKSIALLLLVVVCRRNPSCANEALGDSHFPIFWRKLDILCFETTSIWVNKVGASGAQQLLSHHNQTHFWFTSCQWYPPILENFSRLLSMVSESTRWVTFFADFNPTVLWVVYGFLAMLEKALGQALQCCRCPRRKTQRIIYLLYAHKVLCPATGNRKCDSIV